MLRNVLVTALLAATALTAAAASASARTEPVRDGYYASRVADPSALDGPFAGFQVRGRIISKFRAQALMECVNDAGDRYNRAVLLRGRIDGVRIARNGRAIDAWHDDRPLVDVHVEVEVDMRGRIPTLFIGLRSETSVERCSGTNGIDLRRYASAPRS